MWGPAEPGQVGSGRGGTCRGECKGRLLGLATAQRGVGLVCSFLVPGFARELATSEPMRAHLPSRQKLEWGASTLELGGTDRAAGGGGGRGGGWLRWWQLLVLAGSEGPGRRFI